MEAPLSSSKLPPQTGENFPFAGSAFSGCQGPARRGSRAAVSVGASGATLVRAAV
jgi:hypothetical protein